MQPDELLLILHTAEKLKDTTRHCCTSGGRRESVAEHSWRLALMAFFLRDEFPRADMDKVLRMCLIHDLGECFTGDIPSFSKTAADEAREERLLHAWVDALPAPYAADIRTLNLTTAQGNVAFSPYLTALRQAIRRETEEKIDREKKIK